MKPLSKAAQKRHAAFTAAVLALCRRFNVQHASEYSANVLTRHGDLIVTPYQGIAGPWISLRFHGERPNERLSHLLGSDYNDYSRKWNIHLAGGNGYDDLAEHTLSELERRLEMVALPPKPSLTLGHPTGWGTYIHHPDSSEPVGCWEITSRPCRVTLRSTQHGRTSGLFPAHLEDRVFPTPSAAHAALVGQTA